MKSNIITLLLILNCAALAQGVKFERYLTDAAGYPLINNTVELVPQANTYPAGAYYLICNRRGYFYRENVAPGEYKLFIDGSLIKQHIFVSGSKLYDIMDKFSQKIKLDSSAIDTATIKTKYLLDSSITVRKINKNVWKYLADTNTIVRTKYTQIIAGRKTFADTIKGRIVYADTSLYALAAHNADMLDGLHLADIDTVAYAVSAGGVSGGLTGSFVYISSLQISSYLLQARTRTVTFIGGGITDISAESAWTTIGTLPGTHYYSGQYSGAPAASMANNGDIAFCEDSNYTFIKSNGAWIKVN